MPPASSPLDPTHRLYLDRLLRQQLCIPTHAQTLVALAAAPLAVALDWERMVVEPASDIDQLLHERQADLVVSVPPRSDDGPPARIHIVIELQSGIDSRAPLRAAFAKLGRWQRDVAAAGSGHQRLQLTPVITILVYLGRKRWARPRSWHSLFARWAQPHLGELPAWPDYVIALHQLPVEALTGDAHFLAFLAVIQCRHADAATYAARLLDAVARAQSARPVGAAARAVIGALVRLSWHARDRSEWPALVERLHDSIEVPELHREVDEIMKSYAQEIFERGEALGEARGKALGEARGKALGEARGKALGEAIGKALGEAIGETHGIRSTLLLVLERRLGPVDDATRDRIGRCADVVSLRRWVENALVATSVDDVFRDA